MEKKCSQIKSLTNFLGVYSHLYEDTSKDESFFLKLLKQYRKYFNGNKFSELIDLPVGHPSTGERSEPSERVGRKGSFTLM